MLHAYATNGLSHSKDAIQKALCNRPLVPQLIFLSPHPVFFCDVSVVAVHGELLRVEDLLVARVAEELLVVFVEGARVERDPAVEALDAPTVERLAISGHHLKEKKKYTNFPVYSTTRPASVKKVVTCKREMVILSHKDKNNKKKFKKKKKKF
jgi:hypothetical protein